MIKRTTDQVQLTNSKPESADRPGFMDLDQLCAIFSESIVPTLIRDTQSRLNVFYNDAMEKLTGYCHSEVRDIETWITKIYPDRKIQIEALRKISRSAQRQLIVKGEESIITRKDNCQRNVEFSIYNVTLGQHQTACQILQGMDVTSHRNIQREFLRVNSELAALNQQLESRVKRRTTELKKSQMRLEMALEGAKEGLWVIDFTEGNMNFSRHSAKMLGYELDDLGTTSNKWDQITHPQDWPKVEQALKDHFEGKTEYYEQQYRARTKSGKWKWVLGHGRVTRRDDKGNPIEAIGTHVDITELKQTELRLRKSEQKFKLLVEDAPFGLLILDQKRQIEYFNPKFKELFGYTAEELPDLDSWLDRAYPDPKYRETVARTWENIFQRNFSLVNGEVEPFHFTVRCRNGDEKNIKFDHVYLKNNKYLVCYEDVTARTLAEEALKVRESELELKNEELKEMNNALRVLLQRIEKDKSVLEEKVLLNIKDLVTPYLDSLENTRLSSRQQSYIEILKSNLNEIVSPFSRKLSASHLYLTPKEIQVANLIKENKGTKEIAELLNISISAVQFHRHNIRRKLGLVDKKINLMSYLRSIV
ncbi:PAS domain S-box protein [Desulforhopalus singaporensis]|uniref:histidine kinase n=1 Tax=Desulforhopalus singaporensis TaxID=91360 RepID=A0A1H0SJ83_9BACT|nr:PAS domain S-box protein [Desulforhopalus singaporensis]SDP41760.1 PAS domain S-box-containing protein [Desulforhopalus singaporensis]